MDIKDAQERRKNLNSTIRKILADFERESGCLVEDVKYQRRYLGSSHNGERFYEVEVDVKALI